MRKKIKVTYNEYGTVKAKILYINGWWNFANDLSALSIQADNIIKVEVLLEAEPENITDTTK